MAEDHEENKYTYCDVCECTLTRCECGTDADLAFDSFETRLTDYIHWEQSYCKSVSEKYDHDAVVKEFTQIYEQIEEQKSMREWKESGCIKAAR